MKNITSNRLSNLGLIDIRWFFLWCFKYKLMLILLLTRCYEFAYLVVRRPLCDVCHAPCVVRLLITS